MATEHASYSILYRKSKEPDKYGRVPKGWRGFDEITEDRAAVILGDNIDDVATSLVYDDTKGDEGDIDYGVISFSKDLDYEKPYYIEGDEALYGDDPEEILAQWINTCCILLEEDGCVICDTERNPDCDPFIFDPETYTRGELRADFMYDL